MRASELIAELNKWPDCDVDIQHDPNFNANGIGGAYACRIKAVKAYAGDGDGHLVLVPSVDLFKAKP